MKRTYIVIFVALMFISLNSCSVYRNNPTPDDVYYSPGTPAVSQAAAQNNNTDYYSTPNDNYVKMRVQNPEKWSYFDDYNYDYYGGGFAPYSPYSYGPSVGLSIGFGAGYYSPYYGGFGYYSPLSYYNSYYAWNNFYNPYYGGVVIVNGKNNSSPAYTRMSNFNPSAYQGNYYNARPATNFINSNAGRNTTNSSGNNVYRSSNSRPAFNNNNSNYSPMRSSPSNFGGGGGMGGGGGASRGGGISRPGR